MASEEAKKPHSAEYFGESRDYWWNADFLRLMAERWELRSVRTVLDVGCGIGHWGRVLAKVLPPEARLTGVDREPKWVEEARARAAAAGLSGRFSYQQGDAGALPFPDASFDLVTCQTVLIHVPDPKAVLREMQRVLVPGGLLAVAEPNNFAGAAALDSLGFDEPVDQVMAALRFQLVCQRGKSALGLGHNSIGELVPGYFIELGLEGVQVFLSDKASPLQPPYASAEQRAEVREFLDWLERGFPIWSREETQRYFLAGGGLAADFDRCCEAALGRNRAVAKAISAGTYHGARGAFTYLVSGRRPR
ncbi:MAG: class I SAM-dependent methyltransferase [Myxococcaceae bacterium]